MKLRTKRRLVNLCSLALVAGAGSVVVSAWQIDPPPIEIVTPRVQELNAVAPESPVLNAASPSWERVLRRPLYDPPPPPPPQVVVQSRPITVQLIGTVIEPKNSQAFVKQSGGAVELKRVGDQVTPDPADGVVDEITPTEIVIRREDGEHRLAVQRSN
jgi:hypothetical protein